MRTAVHGPAETSNINRGERTEGWISVCRTHDPERPRTHAEGSMMYRGKVLGRGQATRKEKQEGKA